MTSTRIGEVLISAAGAFVSTKQAFMDQRLKALESGIGHANSSDDSLFTSGYVDIKGFCDFKSTRDKGITRMEATTLLGTLTQLLPDELKNYIM